ncbi:MAG: hypothetical protein ACI4TP_05435 [Anaerotignum sp.]
MTKQEAEKRLNRIIEETPADYDYEIVFNEWSNYGKHRLYISIYEKSRKSKHFAKYDFGFIDLETDEYHPNEKRRNDLTKNYNLGGKKFEEKEEIEEVEENKEEIEMTRQDAEAKLNKIIERSTKAFDYEIVFTEEKNKLLVSVIETGKNSSHRAKYDFGFISLVTGEYHAGKNNLNRNYNLGGDTYLEGETFQAKQFNEECTKDELMESVFGDVKKVTKYLPQRTPEEIKSYYFRTWESGEYSHEESFNYFWNKPVYQISYEGRKEFFDTEEKAQYRKDELIERFGIPAEMETVPQSERVIYGENHRQEVYCVFESEPIEE